MENSYKVYQLIGYFVMKFSYATFLIKGIERDDEVWLINPKHANYQIIRISANSIEYVPDDLDRVKQYIELISKHIHMADSKFLDIHIGREEVYEDDYFDTLCIDTDYFDTICDLKPIYPGIESVIHEVDNPAQEISEIIQDISRDKKAIRRQRLQLNTLPCICTYIIMAICILNYLITEFLAVKYTRSAAFILTGANYPTFTKDLFQFYRLLTCGFCHSSPSHLIFNMMSLYTLGRVFEYNYGHLKFLLMLFSGVFVSSLTYNIFGINGITVGLSGGLYTLLTLYIYTIYKQRGNISNLYGVILINLMINFIPNVAWQAHLGGAIVGILFYYILEEKKYAKRFIVSVCVIALSLSIYFYGFVKLDKYYMGTDLEVTQAYRDAGWNSIADKLENKLIKIYYGGK